MNFQGTVKSRTSGRNAKGAGPPGEAEVLRLNPGREERLKEEMRWASVEPGTLNLKVRDEIVRTLLDVTPTLTEEPGEVTYPPPYEEIPKRRGGYLYYRARISVKPADAIAVLIRLARNPVKGIVEVFAEVRLRDALGLTDKDVVDVEICSSN